MQIAQAIEIAKAFLKDTIEFMGIVGNTINIVTNPTLPSINGIPQHATIDAATNTITLSELFLTECCQKNGFTPLRIEIYAKVRMLYFNYYPNELRGGDIVMESLYFATALALLKGLPVPELPHDYFSHVIRVLKKEFNVEAVVFQMPTELYSEIHFYQIRLSESEAKLYQNRYFPVPARSTVKSFGEKGSKVNPFDNVYDAIDYIRQLEENAHSSDNLLQDIEQQKYFYDLQQGRYRIHWATPFVSQYVNNFPVRSFMVNQMDTGRFSFKPNLYRRKFLFRGQSKSYEGSPCVPNLFRDKEHNKKKYFLEYLIFSQEMELLIRTHPLVRLLESGIELLHDTFCFRMNTQGLTQHYYNKSTFLDLTSDLEVMKFFATTDYDGKTDKYYPHLDTSELGVIYCYELQYPTAFQQHKGYSLKTIGKQMFMRPGSQCGFLLQMEQGVDLKTLPEVTSIFFRHNSAISEEIFRESSNGEEYFATDILQMAWKDRLCQRRDNRIVSRKTVEYNAAMNGETVETITQKLKEIDICVDDYVPSFTSDELDIYFDSIRNGWWDVFCNDIHFYGAEDELYRQALKEIPQDSRYKRAFGK